MIKIIAFLAGRPFETSGALRNWNATHSGSDCSAGLKLPK